MAFVLYIILMGLLGHILSRGGFGLASWQFWLIGGIAAINFALGCLKERAK